MSERERLVGAVMTLAERVDFLKNRNPEQAASLMRGLTGRLGMESHEVGALLGFVRRTLWHLDQKSARAGNDPTSLLEPTPLEGESTE
jgi:tRNA C32,U32 (ribose-2'-O)-methylase TrmJ